MGVIRFRKSFVITQSASCSIPSLNVGNKNCINERFHSTGSVIANKPFLNHVILTPLIQIGDFFLNVQVEQVVELQDSKKDSDFIHRYSLSILSITAITRLHINILTTELHYYLVYFFCSKDCVSY